MNPNTQKTIKRFVLLPADVQKITGLTYDASRKEVARIKAHLKKGADQKLSIKEYCDFSGLNYDDTLIFLAQ